MRRMSGRRWLEGRPLRNSNSNALLVIARAARTRRGKVGLTLAGSVVLVAVLGPFVAPHSSTAFYTTPYATPSGSLLLGGDTLGRDTLSRVLDGGWVLLLMSLAATMIGVSLGSVAGIAAAYRGGALDALIMRGVDVVLAFPQLVFALLLVSVVGPKLWVIVFAVGFSHAPAVTRVLRSATLDVSERPFIKAVELNGVRPLRIMRSEILPSITTPIVVEFGMRLTFSIVVMAGLAYLGFGQPPPAPNWGYMISENRVGLVSNPWSVVVPAVLIALLTVGVNTFGDAVARVSMGAAGRRSELALESGALGTVGIGAHAAAQLSQSEQR
jgi:peptide/nickel transport system permease protein